MKRIILFIIAVIVIASAVAIYIKNQSNDSVFMLEFSEGDLNFYNEHKETPINLTNIRVGKNDILWSADNRSFSFTSTQDVQAVYITPVIQELANYFVKNNLNNRTLQAKEAYDFVWKNIQYNYSRIDGRTTQYPVTTIIRGNGVCRDMSVLLAAILWAEGFHDLGLVYTRGHVYVAVNLTEVYNYENSVQKNISNYLGLGWIGLDPTIKIGFGYLNPYNEYHWNITEIIKVQTIGYIMNITSDWQGEYVPNQFGYGEFDCELYAFTNDKDNDVTFRFILYQNSNERDKEIISITSKSEIKIKITFRLDYEPLLDDTIGVYVGIPLVALEIIT